MNKMRLVRSFIELVKIDSESGHEDRIARIISSKLKKLGLRVKRDNKGNLIALLEGDKRARTLLFNAHMDTVVPGKNVQPRLSCGKIIGNGHTVLGADDKAGIAVILEMLKVIRQEKILHGDIKVIFTVEEEIGLCGARKLSIKDTQADLCFVLDSDGDVGTVVNRSPAQDSLNVVIHGRAAHAGICPERGISAIEIAARAITGMRLGRIDKETTANIGIIQGGKATNIVPEEVLLRGEARSHSAQKLKRQTNNMLRCIKQAACQAGGKVQLFVQRSYDAIALPEKAPILELTKKAARKIKVPHRILSSGGGSDANIIHSRGVPTVALGIGMENVHSKHEYIEVRNLCKAAEFILEIVKETAHST